MQRGNQVFTIYNGQPQSQNDDLPQYWDVVLIDPPTYEEVMEKEGHERSEKY